MSNCPSARRLRSSAASGRAFYLSLLIRSDKDKIVGFHEGTRLATLQYLLSLLGRGGRHACGSSLPRLPRSNIKRAVEMGKICGSAGPGGHFCSMKLGHLGDCVIGFAQKCEPTQKRQRETAPQAAPSSDNNLTNTAGEKRPKAAAPSRQAAAEMTTPAPQPMTAATKDKSAVKTKLAAKPKAARAARGVWVCGTTRSLGQGTSSSFCSKKHGHLGNCFED